jgi:hypothetical protein
LYASRTITEKRIELPLPVSRGHVDGFVALQKCDILSARGCGRVSQAILFASLVVARASRGSGQDLSASCSPVGWVERSDAHQCRAQKVQKMMGFASLYPSYDGHIFAFSQR